MTSKTGRLANKVAIVTGGASGIGEATSQIFAREGAHVIIVDIQVEMGEALAHSIREEGHAAEFLRADMSQVADVKMMIDHAERKFGRLDGLINNAAVESPKREIDTSEEEYDRMMEVNVKGVFFASKFAVMLMKKSGGGSIVNISSGYGIIGSTGFAAYHASKGAVRALTKATAVANARDGIRANCIFPGAIKTPLLGEAIRLSPDPKAAEVYFAQSQPIGRLGKPEEIAYGCLYFVSDESKFCIGAELSIDGGMVAS